MRAVYIVLKLIHYCGFGYYKTGMRLFLLSLTTYYGCLWCSETGMRAFRLS